jgi:hypothetical protein
VGYPEAVTDPNLNANWLVGNANGAALPPNWLAENYTIAPAAAVRVQVRDAAANHYAIPL